MSWQGALNTAVALDGPDSPGAQPYGSFVAPGAMSGTSLALPITATSALPSRPTTVPAPSAFLAQPTGPITANTTYTAQVPGTTTPPAGGYYPGDTIRLLFSIANLGTGPFNVIVQTGTSQAVIGEILASKVTTGTGLGYIDIQLNAAGTAWVSIGGGYL